VHGEAWLGLLNMSGHLAAKRWFLFPPGQGLSAGQQAELNPYIPVSKQVTDLFPARARGVGGDGLWAESGGPDLPAPSDIPGLAFEASSSTSSGTSSSSSTSTSTSSTSTSSTSASVGAGGTPAHCLQRPGEVLYVPAGWAHMTLNQGECVYP
jgi:hypothetical protein